MELEKIFNDLKHEPEFGMEYATEVSKFVAQGACRDFRRADENWRNPTLNAARPTFKKKNRIGTGSFLAASGVDRVKYDDHRRIRLPYLGSVKLQRELPEGIPYEVRIKQENGRWYASVNYWKPPVGAEEKTHLCGAVDVGITPLAVDSELVHYENPRALYRMLAKLQRWQRTLARSARAHQCDSPAHQRATGQRAPPGQPPAGQEVRSTGHREPERGGHGQTAPSGQGHP